MKLKDAIYIGLIILALLFYFGKDSPTVYKDVIRTDTIYKTVTLPPVHDTIYLTDFKERIVTRYKVDSTLVDSISILNALIDAKTVREYTNTHKDSLVTISTTSQVEGKLLFSQINYTLKPRKFQTIETHTTIEKHPKYALFYGGNIQTASRFDNTAFEINFGYQNKRGDVMEVGVNTNKQITLGFKKRFALKY